MEKKSETKIQTANVKQLFKRAATIFIGCALLASTLTSFAGCKSDDNKADPLWKAGSTRNKIVVISDLHLGIDDRYTETLDNRPLLIEFLKQLQKTDDVRELVIAGDFLDDWYLPVYYPSYTDTTKFYQDCVTNNQGVIDELKKVISSGIKLVYVPGNHDMLLESKVLDEAIPGIVQVVDAKGLGAYYTGDRNEIVIEHGHRYDVFSAPDTVTNAELCGNDNTMLPPGYFYARYAATWVLEKSPTVEKELPVISNEPEETDIDKYGAFSYYKVIKKLTAHITPNEPLEQKIFDMRIAGFNDAYTFLDFYPVQNEDGSISAPVLFRNIQRTWEERQEINKVKVLNSFIDAAEGAVKSDYFLSQAKLQYLENPNESVDVVVFGHTHVPINNTMENGKLYVNSGTWVDHNNLDSKATRIFAVIETGEKDKANLYKYEAIGSIAEFSSSTQSKVQ